MKVRLYQIVCLALMLAAVPAFGAVTTYSNRGTWETNVGSFTTIDFESFGISPVYGTSNAVLYSGGYSLVSDCSAAPASGEACFVNNGTYTYTVDTGALAPPRASNHYFRLSETSVTAYMQITLGPGITWGGMDVFTGFGNFNVNLYDSSNTLVGTYTNNTPGFFGFQSDDSIAMIRLSSNAFNEVYLDQLDFNTINNGGGDPSPSETPEAASLSYMVFGLLALWFGSRKKIPTMRRSQLARS